MKMTQLSNALFVGPQIEVDDLEVLARDGFTDVICNRPDIEHPTGPVSRIMAERAKDLKLAFHYLPISPGEPCDKQADKLAQLVLKPDAKIFAYCRSGARSANAWAMVESA